MKARVAAAVAVAALKMTESEDNSTAQFNTPGSKIFLCTLAVLFFLLPIKFVTSWFTPVPTFPEGFFSSSWTHYLMQVIIAVMAVAAIVIYKPQKLSRAATLSFTVWLILCVAVYFFDSRVYKVPET